MDEALREALRAQLPLLGDVGETSGGRVSIFDGG